MRMGQGVRTGLGQGGITCVLQTQFSSFPSNGPGYLHPVCSELENSGSRVAVGDCSVTEPRDSVRISNWPNCTCARKHTTNMTRNDAWHRVCTAMVPYH